MSTTKSSFVSLGAIGIKIISTFAKLAKSLKFILAAGTFAGYSFLFTWKFALLIMFGVGIHEMGHVWAMRRCGLKTKGFYFIPFVGGAAISNDAFKSGKEEIYVALMGPVFGVITILPALIMFLLTDQPIWAAAASFLAVINLFNLFPINPLDGGRVIKSLALSLNKNIGIFILCAGFVLAISLSHYFGLFLLGFIAVIGMLEFRPFATWFVLAPLAFIFAQILGVLTFTTQGFRGYIETQRDFYRFIKETKITPIIDGFEGAKANHWNLTLDQKIKYTSWYLGLCVLFLFVILIFGHVPGGDVSIQFLKA